MKWTVTVSRGSIEKTYEVTEDRYYAAKIEGIRQFLDENKIPGKPWEYISRRRGVLGVVVEAQTGSSKPSTPTTQFYQEKVLDFRRLVREGPLNEDTKLKASDLLLQLQEVFNG